MQQSSNKHSNTLINAKFHKDSNMNGCMHFSAPKKCPLLEHGIEQSKLACWLGEKARLTTKLAKQIIEPFAEQCAEYSHNRTTWNEAARQAHEKCKLRSTTTAKVVAPHPEQVPTLLKRLIDKSIPEDNDMIIDESASIFAGSSTRPMTQVKHMAVLPFFNCFTGYEGLLLSFFGKLTVFLPVSIFQFHSPLSKIKSEVCQGLIESIPR